MPRRFSTILFDLDGTLLHIDVEAFFPDYFARLGSAVSGYTTPEKFIPRLMRATEAMIANRDPAVSNREVFLEVFFANLNTPRDELMSVFEAFYRTEFPKLSGHARPAARAREVVETVLASGRKAVIATSPVFPRLAVEERLRWANLGGLPFALVTTYEDMHFCKPHPEYYAEILTRLHLLPGECLMVGNDVEEDLPAQDVGIAVYLAGPDVIHRGRRPRTPDFEGPLEGLLSVLDDGVAS